MNLGGINALICKEFLSIVSLNIFLSLTFFGLSIFRYYFLSDKVSYINLDALILLSSNTIRKILNLKSSKVYKSKYLKKF